MKLHVDPHIYSPTEIFMNGELYTKINGSVEDQIEKIKEIIIQYDIWDWSIDKKGFGMAWYDKLNEWFEIHKTDIIAKRRKQEIMEDYRL